MKKTVYTCLILLGFLSLAGCTPMGAAYIGAMGGMYGTMYGASKLTQAKIVKCNDSIEFVNSQPNLKIAEEIGKSLGYYSVDAFLPSSNIYGSFDPNPRMIRLSNSKDPLNTPISSALTFNLASREIIDIMVVWVNDKRFHLACMITTYQAVGYDAQKTEEKAKRILADLKAGILAKTQAT